MGELDETLARLVESFEVVWGGCAHFGSSLYVIYKVFDKLVFRTGIARGGCVTVVRLEVVDVLDVATKRTQRKLRG